MNAYKLLGIEDLVSKDPSAIEKPYINGVIKIRTKLKLDEGIKGLNQILKEKLGITEKLAKIEEKLKQLFKEAVAYDFVATEETRKDYAKKGEPEIEQVVEKINKTLNSAVDLETNGQTSNAYQILGVANDKKNDREPELQDKSIETKIYENIALAISVSKLTDIQEIESFLLNLIKYFWAYSKIGTAEKRKEYKYEELAKKGDKAEKALGEARVRAIENQQTYSMDITSSSKYDRVDISKVAVIQSSAFGVDEQHGYGYIIDKHKTDEAIERNQIFSNIDINRMRDDVIYREKVLEQLLSDEAIRLGREKLGGYVGELDDNGNIKFDLEFIGACRAWKRRKNKEKAQNMKKNNNQENNRKIQPTDPDPDSDDRR